MTIFWTYWGKWKILIKVIYCFFHFNVATRKFKIWPSIYAIAKSRQLCLTLCDPIDGSPTGSSVPGILQARTLEWVAISFSNAWKWKVKVKSLSRVRLLATPWTVAYQAPSMEFSRQEYWSGLPLPSPIYAIGPCYSWDTDLPDYLVSTTYTCVKNLLFLWISCVSWDVKCG